jgi:hypothetical protein
MMDGVPSKLTGRSIGRSIIAGGALLVPILLGRYPVAAATLDPPSPPVLVSSMASPGTVTAGSSVTLSYTVTSALGISRVGVVTSGPGASSLSACNGEAATLASGDEYSGTYQIACTVPDDAPSGTWSSSVVLVDTGGETVVSEGAAGFTVTGVADPPTDVVATPADGSASVTWVPPRDDGGSAVYTYTAVAMPGGEECNYFVVGPETDSCTVDSLTNGQNYTFTVTATNAAGTSLPSKPSLAVTPHSSSQKGSVPSAPLEEKASVKLGSVVITWHPPASDGGSIVLGYVASISSGNKASRCRTTTYSCTFSKLPALVPITLSVAAINAIGSGPPDILPYEIFPIASSNFSVESIPIAVQAKAGFTLLASGASPGKKVQFGVPGSIHECMVDPIGQCWAYAKAYRTGVWKAVAKSGTSTASWIFYVPSVNVPLQVAHGSKETTSIAFAPPGCQIIESFSGRSYSTKASRSGGATLRVKASKVGAMSLILTIDGTQFAPFSMDVT